MLLKTIKKSLKTYRVVEDLRSLQLLKLKVAGKLNISKQVPPIDFSEYYQLEKCSCLTRYDNLLQKISEVETYK